MHYMYLEVLVVCVERCGLVCKVSRMEMEEEIGIVTEELWSRLAPWFSGIPPKQISATLFP